MAQFEPAYQLERKHEGYYVNNPYDKGGETYAGVARNYHPTWGGWPVLDQYKATLGRALKTNEQVPGMEPYVESFYRNLWNAKGFGNIFDQNVANIVYDWYINSGNTGIRETQKVLRDQFYATLTVDGLIGPDTIRNINAQQPVPLHDAIKQKRIDFYNSLVARDPSQSIFLNGWLARINSFPWLGKAALGLSGILLLAGLFFLVYKLNEQ